jgi:hypothetical protein
LGWRDLEVRRSFRVPLTPALALALATLSLALSVFLGRWAVESVPVARAISADRLCAVDSGGPCLDEVTGRLGGGSSIRRTAYEEWSVSGAGGLFLADPAAAAAFARWDDEIVTGQTFHGDLVAIRTPDGATYQSGDAGSHAVVMWGSAALGLLLVGPLVIQGALRQRRSSGSWWRGGEVQADPGRKQRATLLSTPLLVGGLMFVFAAPWWVALTIVAAIVVPGVLYRAARREWERRHPLRHGHKRHARR